MKIRFSDPLAAVFLLGFKFLDEVALNVRLDVEYARAEDKLVRILDCLQKTAPPVSVHLLLLPTLC